MSKLEYAIDDLDTVCKAFHEIAQQMEDRTLQPVVRFVSQHFQHVHDDLRKAFDEAWKALTDERPGPKAVS